MISTNYNPSVLTTQRNLNLASFSLNTALERMSTGYKVNCAADDAAGMFVASNLNANIRGLKQAQKNAQDGISLLNTAEGSLSNMTNILNRLRDLAVQGANGVYDENSLDAMQNEADSLVAQLKQIQQGTLFNGKSIFNTNATWSLTTQNAGTAAISTLSGGVSAKTPDTNSLAGINTLNSTPDAKSSSGFIQQINRLSEQEAIAQGYTVIKTAQDLDNIRNDLDGKYILMNDIDLSSYSNWDPIGEIDMDTGTGQGFTGVLDGNGYTISNLTINRPDEDYVGLFCSTLGQSGMGEIKNLRLTDVNVVGGKSVGTLTGYGANISNCFASGDVTCTVQGGLLMGIGGGNIVGCYTEGSVTGLDGQTYYGNVGGLMGMAIGANVSECCSDVILKTNSTNADIGSGGLIGMIQSGSISNCYTKGEVSSGVYVGGIAGISLSSNINNSFSMMESSGLGYIGGIAGTIDVDSSLTNSIWNTETTGQSLAVGNNQGGTESDNKGLTTAEMQNPANWQGWDTSVWDFSTYPPTFKMYTPVDGGSTGGGTGGTDPSDPGGGNAGGAGDVPIPGAVRLQIGSDSCSTSAIYVDTSFDLGAFDVDFSSADSCAAAIEDIDEVLSRINTKRSEFGAVINRLSSILESQTTTIQNFTSAKSTIMDADIANESADFVKNQILQQTSSALLAQSQNLHASIVLSLIG